MLQAIQETPESILFADKLAIIEMNRELNETNEMKKLIENNKEEMKKLLEENKEEIKKLLEQTQENINNFKIKEEIKEENKEEEINNFKIKEKIKKENILEFNYENLHIIPQQLTKFNETYNNLLVLSLSGNRLTEVNNLILPVNLIQLDLSKNILDFFPLNLCIQSPNLKILDVSNNEMTDTLDITNTQLEYLSCEDNFFKEFKSNLTIKQLILKNNQFKKLYNIYKSNNLEYLDISDNYLTELPTFPVINNITHLDCSHNVIKIINFIPDTLTYLNFSDNKNITLHFDLPLCLETLIAYNCDLSWFTWVYPDSLTYLDFSINSLTTISSLPKNIVEVNYNSNLLTTISNIKFETLLELEKIDIRDNLITNLPESLTSNKEIIIKSTRYVDKTVQIFKSYNAEMTNPYFMSGGRRVIIV
jgi:Leucine-rich repeat (LRR) protein